MLTVQVLTLNNIGTVEDCIDSAFSVGDRVLVGDLGSEDGTPEVCRKMGAEVSRLDSKGNFSELRNSLSVDGRNMYLEPWESIASGRDEIRGLCGEAAFYVVQGGTVSKQVRFWTRGRFRNPVFEYLDAGESAVVRPGVVLVSRSAPDRRRMSTEACREWSEANPTSPDPYYYLACSLLSEGRLDEFMGVAGKYMIMAGGLGESSLLMNYYMARVEASKGAFKQASARTLQCIALRPTFAEFWCLLGDMLYTRGKYEKARDIYRNARIIGAMRRSDDLFPIEVTKYESYPKEMEIKCSELAGSGFVVEGKVAN